MSESPQPAPHPQLQHPGVAPAALAGFAEQLRELWLSAGKPSYRDISGRLHARTGRFYSKSVIGDVLAGRRAPKQRCWSTWSPTSAATRSAGRRG